MGNLTAFPVRHLDDGTPQYNIKCHKCGRSDWASVPRGKTAYWVISQKGWLIGSRRTTDECPACREQKTNRREVKVIQRLAEKETPPIVLNPVLDPVMADKIKRAMSPPGTYARMDNARVAAIAHLRRKNNDRGKYVNGIDFYTYKLPGRDLWEWVLKEDATAEQLALHKAVHKKAPYTGSYPTTINRKKAKGLIPAIEKTKEQAMQLPSTQEDQSTPMQNEANTNIPKATRAQNAQIMDALTDAYDEKAQRYKDNGSDKVLADRLEMPRIWITAIREQFFGDYDRNEAAEKHAAKLDEAIKVAEAATARLLEMASEAEKLANELKAARQKYA